MVSDASPSTPAEIGHHQICDTGSDLCDFYSPVGVGFRADKIIDLAIAYKTGRVENDIGSVTTSDGALSSGASGSGPGYEVQLRV